MEIDVHLVDLVEEVVSVMVAAQALCCANSLMELRHLNLTNHQPAQLDLPRNLSSKTEMEAAPPMVLPPTLNSWGNQAWQIPAPLSKILSPTQGTWHNQVH